MLTLERLESLLLQLPQMRIGLVGDLFLDRYLELEAGEHELSIETGLEAYQVARIRNSPGALGTVMNNLAALEVGSLVPVTVIGDDGHGDDLMRCLSTMPVTCDHVWRSAERLTPTYTKPLRPDPAGAWFELNRLDVRTRAPLSPADCQHVVQSLREVHRDCDGLIVLDQVAQPECGVVNGAIRDLLQELSATAPEKPILVDSRAAIHRFRQVMLKGNEAELRSATGRETTEDAVRELAALAGKTVFCTIGQRGILVGDPCGEVVLAQGYPAPGPLDIVGAGDSASSGILVSLLAGATPPEAATVGNLVASITVQQLGTTGSATPAQVMHRWRQVQ
jgi:bifunctional ADP-heptose synthase (sugar kinase/adenylyltransferase)